MVPLRRATRQRLRASACISGVELLGQVGQVDIAEVVAYDHALTTTDRQSVESYLQAKWLITAPQLVATASAAATATVTVTTTAPVVASAAATAQATAAVTAPVLLTATARRPRRPVAPSAWHRQLQPCRRRLGANWTAFSGSPDVAMAITSNQARGTGSAVWSGAIRTAETYAPTSSQRSSTGHATGRDWIGMTVRTKNNGQDCYRAIYFNNAGAYELRIGLRSAGTPTTLQTSSLGATPLAIGTVLRLSVVGNTLRLLVNGSQVLTATDSTIVSGGSPGMITFASGAAPSTGQIDNWQGGNMLTGPVRLPPGAADSTAAARPGDVRGHLRWRRDRAVGIRDRAGRSCRDRRRPADAHGIGYRRSGRAGHCADAFHAERSGRHCRAGDGHDNRAAGPCRAGGHCRRRPWSPRSGSI